MGRVCSELLSLSCGGHTVRASGERSEVTIKDTDVFSPVLLCSAVVNLVLLCYSFSCPPFVKVLFAGMWKNNVQPNDEFLCQKCALNPRLKKIRR